MTPQTKLTRYLATDPFFRAVYDYTQKRFQSAPHLTAHNWEHAYRDVLNAITIGESEQADMTIVLPATIMHDIGFLYGATGKTHGAIGADKLDDYLGEGGLTCPQSKLDHIRACILTHKGSMHGEAPQTLEAKVVSDADLLEKLGPIGVYQSIRTFTEFNYPAARIIHNLERMEDWAFQTKTGQTLADQLKPFSANFAQALQEAYAPYLPDASQPQ